MDTSTNNLTAIFLTNNELPDKWMAFHKKCLLEAHQGDIITCSRKPMDIPGINIIQTEPKSQMNVYWQMLKAARLATTEYIAIVEDDSLYPAEHFLYRPAPDVFAYNKTHWSLFTWGEPVYNWRDRKGNYTMVCSRQLLLDALEERFSEPRASGAWGELGRPQIEDSLGVTRRKSEDFYTGVAVINICHKWGLDDRTRRRRKTLGWLRAYDIPHWGRSDTLIQHFI